MYLLVDAGNTRLKYMLSIDGGIGELAQCSNREFLERLAAFTDLKAIALASVANDAFNEQIAQWAQQQQVNFILLETQAESFAIKNSYANYHTMGVDRWLAVVGAQWLYPHRNAIIIDSGTATTVDVLSANKQHLGGWIAPGIQLMANSLFSHTDKVFGEVSSVSRLAFGTSTSDNVNFGVWSSAVGLVVQAQRLCEQHQLTDPLLLFTGGNGAELNKLGDFNGAVIPDLVFHGIARFLRDSQHCEQLN
ncbi:type III pantothenate kinase [Thalassotalea ponticola]|uniref:type III pantothenate kinase n=1 Tax=Thalassotalea ponticola TaxID=1523392 RepID=UPI0025B589A6|nr:type III pantothenate kinase [Thalassotalea ponticola]MDN3652826.1 type III pantothenate kinase [Thalassotalea ponticola]